MYDGENYTPPAIPLFLTLSIYYQIPAHLLVCSTPWF